MPIADYALHAVVTPFPGVIRVAGTAEFAGFDRRLNEARIRNLWDLVRRILPQAPLELATARPWCAYVRCQRMACRSLGGPLARTYS